MRISAVDVKDLRETFAAYLDAARNGDLPTDMLELGLLYDTMNVLFVDFEDDEARTQATPLMVLPREEGAEDDPAIAVKVPGLNHALNVIGRLTTNEMRGFGIAEDDIWLAVEAYARYFPRESWITDEESVLPLVEAQALARAVGEVPVDRTDGIESEVILTILDRYWAGDWNEA